MEGRITLAPQITISLKENLMENLCTPVPLTRKEYSLYVLVPIVISCVILHLAHGKRCWGNSLPQEVKGAHCCQGASRKKPLLLRFLLFPASPLLLRSRSALSPELVVTSSPQTYSCETG